MARITRKELKTDKFALEVEHTVSFFEEHRQELMRYGAIAGVVIVLLLGYSVYRRHARTERQEALTQALTVEQAVVGQAAPGMLTFPTQEAKDAAVTKAFADIASKYSGSDEGAIAQYYNASVQADQGKLADAEKQFQAIVDKADSDVASLARFSLSQIYTSTGRADQAEKILRDLMAHPTIYVSKDQAALSLAYILKDTKPAEARTLLDPLRAQNNAAGQMAVSMLGQMGAR